MEYCDLPAEEDAVDSGAEPAAATESGAGASTPGKSPRLLKGGAHEADSTAKVRASKADGVLNLHGL